MPPPCPELLQSGECYDVDYCSFNHDLPFCVICDRYFQSIDNYRNHVAGSAHRQRVEALDSEAIALPDGRIQCRCCLSKVGPSDWHKHVNSPKHVAKVRYRRAQDAKASAESNKSNVQLFPEGDVDFGLIEFEEMNAQTAAHQPTQFVKIYVEDRQTVLESVEFRQNPQGGRRQ